MYPIAKFCRACCLRPGGVLTRPGTRAHVGRSERQLARSRAHETEQRDVEVRFSVRPCLPDAVRVKRIGNAGPTKTGPKLATRRREHHTRHSFSRANRPPLPARPHEPTQHNQPSPVHMLNIAKLTGRAGSSGAPWAVARRLLSDPLRFRPVDGSARAWCTCVFGNVAPTSAR